MTEQSTVNHYKKLVASHINPQGLFPDSILGDSYWPLWCCEKVWINGELWWRFVGND